MGSRSCDRFCYSKGYKCAVHFYRICLYMCSFTHTGMVWPLFENTAFQNHLYQKGIEGTGLDTSSSSPLEIYPINSTHGLKNCDPCFMIEIDIWSHYWKYLLGTLARPLSPSLHLGSGTLLRETRERPGAAGLWAERERWSERGDMSRIMKKQGVWLLSSHFISEECFFKF